MKRRPYRGRLQLRKRILSLLAEAELPPAQIAERVGLSLAELAQWTAEAEHAALLSKLLQLSDLRTQMLLSNYRANAAAQLIAIATKDDPTELSRRACVDLLKADLGVFDGPAAEAAPEVKPIDTAAVLKQLEQIGGE